uniref:Uncharacterized protein n=1 Tax=Ananas comosus var. bracteatus TaxID=296719 RepID=A0A6V7PCE0_ANACO|nr:unnamed protein product [Ananas comosus var. bracteatus]
MEIGNPSNGEAHPELENPSDGDAPQGFADDVHSSATTPFASAPSSPGRGSSAEAAGDGGFGYFFSAPASPMHFILCSPPCSAAAAASSYSPSGGGDIEFEFSARRPSAGAAVAGSMSSADELFLNGQIRPLKLSSHLQRPQSLVPLLDLEPDEADDLAAEDAEAAARGREEAEDEGGPPKDRDTNPDPKSEEAEAAAPPVSASSSRSSSSSSSSSGRYSKRWIFLKDLLYRSKSEGRDRGAAKENKFWHSISFSPSSRSKPPTPPPKPNNGAAQSKRASAKRAGAAPSPHVRHYAANRAQAEELRRRTFLPYRQGLLGCLGFTSRSYGAINGLAKTLNPVSSR